MSLICGRNQVHNVHILHLCLLHSYGTYSSSLMVPINLCYLVCFLFCFIPSTLWVTHKNMPFRVTFFLLNSSQLVLSLLIGTNCDELVIF